VAANKRSKAERESDLAAMATLLAKGATQRQLAEQFDLALGTVSYDVKEIEKRWREHAAEAVDLWKGRLVASHDQVILESWQEWERSKADGEKVVEVTELMDSPDEGDGFGLATAGTAPERLLEVTRRTVTIMGRTGDPRYLNTIETALAEKAKIIGAHAADKIEHAGKDGAPLLVTIIRDHPPGEPTEAAS
jgi:hypothetical protein